MSILIATISILLIVICLTTALLAYQVFKLSVEVRAIQNSTHTVQYIDPQQQQFQNFSDEEKQKLNEAFAAFDN